MAAVLFCANRARAGDDERALFAGEAAGLTRDDVLDNVTITWLTNTAISGARLYWALRGQ